MARPFDKFAPTITIINDERGVPFGASGEGGSVSSPVLVDYGLFSVLALDMWALFLMKEEKQRFSMRPEAFVRAAVLAARPSAAKGGIQVFSDRAPPRL